MFIYLRWQKLEPIRLSLFFRYCLTPVNRRTSLSIWISKESNPASNMFRASQQPRISDRCNPYPVAAGFVLSYVQGYHENRRILQSFEKSTAWGLQWNDICRMIASGEDFQPVDTEVLWSNWRYGLLKSENIISFLQFFQVMILKLFP